MMIIPGTTDGKTVLQESVEEYLGAISRLRESPVTPLPLAQLTQYFGYSPVSVHEMVQKLNEAGWVTYHPYRGVTLTDVGESEAQSLLRRHRLWERFLTDVLDVSWSEAHTVAGRLEHVATEEVTERLAGFLGDPQACPHGAPIPPQVRSITERCLSGVPTGAAARLTRIAPEMPERLARLEALGLTPGCRMKVVAQHVGEVTTIVKVASPEQRLDVLAHDAAAVWVELL
jgi:DtxR family Mn-dependent transcriptional regulator